MTCGVGAAQSVAFQRDPCPSERMAGRGVTTLTPGKADSAYTVYCLPFEEC